MQRTLSAIAIERLTDLVTHPDVTMGEDKIGTLVAGATTDLAPDRRMALSEEFVRQYAMMTLGCVVGQAQVLIEEDQKACLSILRDIAGVH